MCLTVVTVASYENGSEPAGVETNVRSNLQSVAGAMTQDAARHNPVFLSRIIFDVRFGDVDVNLSADS